MIPIRDDAVRFMALFCLIARLHQGNVAELVNVGLQPAHIKRLGLLEPAQVQRLALFLQPELGLFLDADAVDAGLRHLAVANDARQLEDYFIKHDASAAMMRSLFTMPMRTTRARRDAIGKRRTAGRPRLPSVALRGSIRRCWDEHSDLDVRQRYYRLHERFPQFGLDILHNVVTDANCP